MRHGLCPTRSRPCPRSPVCHPLRLILTLLAVHETALARPPVQLPAAESRANDDDDSDEDAEYKSLLAAARGSDA
jgi:hypothetical protein